MVDRPVGVGAVGTRALGLVLLGCGVIGFLAAFILTVEKFELLADPSYLPSCSINATFNCGSVMASEQAAAFGFPNSLLGIGGFAIVATTGAALLAGARIAHWFWIGLQIGATAAIVFIHWLITQSLFVIGALCPYCMVVWAVTIPTFWYVSLRNLAALQGRIREWRGAGVVDFILRYHLPLLAFWYLAVIVLVVQAQLFS